MKLTASKLNRFAMFKLPAAYLCGVRVASFDQDHCVTTVRHRWINQNPFRSMFWAVQGMAAELSTGALVMGKIQQTSTPISMLVLENRARFTKKARGRIRFECRQGAQVDAAIAQTLATGEGQTFWMEATGVDQGGAVVSVFEFQWTVKKK